MSIETSDLAKFYPLDKLRPENLEQLAQEAKVEEVARDHVLFKAGDTDDHTIFLLTGGGPVNSTNVLANYTYTTGYFNQDFTAASAAAVVILALSIVLAIFYARSRKAATR